MTVRTWEITDSDGSNRRTVTLAQYRAELEAAKQRAAEAFRAAVATVQPWPEPPPCERFLPAHRIVEHPRYPSGRCVECGAEPHEACKDPRMEPWEKDQTEEARADEIAGREQAEYDCER